MVLWGPSGAAAQEVSGVATASAAAAQGPAAQLEHRDGNRTVRLERDAEGRWRRVETTRVELVQVRPRSFRFKMSLYRAASPARYEELRMAGQKLADKERGTVAILFDGGMQVMAFAPSRASAVAAK